MVAKVLDEALRCIEQRPEAAQLELAQIALEIDASLKGGMYTATPEELAGIDRGLTAARENRFASDEQVREVLLKRRA